MQIEAGPRPSVTRAARAKLNLALSVGPPRESDGYHPIASWMARVDLADDLTLTRLDAGDLSRYAIVWHDEALRPTPIDWSITKDLAVRAHLLVQEQLGRELPVQLKLEKRIPVGGGLGGGSADAAAMLLALDDLFGLELQRERLIEWAMRLGSDVAYCLHEAPAVVEGVGEQITPAEMVRGHALLVAPPFGCATGPVYNAFDAAPAQLRASEVHALARAGSIDSASLFNDLAGAAQEAVPALREIIELVRTCAGEERPVHVTGSGSTLFVIDTEDDTALCAIAQRIRDQRDDVAVAVVALG